MNLPSEMGQLNSTSPGVEWPPMSPWASLMVHPRGSQVSEVVMAIREGHITQEGLTPAYQNTLGLQPRAVSSHRPSTIALSTVCLCQNFSPTFGRPVTIPSITWIYPSIHPSVRPSVRPSIHPSIHSPVRPSIVFGLLTWCFGLSLS